MILCKTDTLTRRIEHNTLNLQERNVNMKSAFISDFCTTFTIQD